MAVKPYKALNRKGQSHPANIDQRRFREPVIVSPLVTSSALVVAPLHSTLDNAFDPQTAEIDVPVSPMVVISKQSDDIPPPEADPQYDPSAGELPADKIAARRRRQVKQISVNKRYNNAIIESMGEDRVLFENVLSFSDLPKARNFMLGLANPRFNGWPLTRIASNYGISATELTLLWRDYHLARGVLAVTKAIPQAMARIAQDAISGETVCPHCDGRTTVVMETPDLDDPEKTNRQIIVCPNCKGEGTIFKHGHEHSRDKMLEMVGLIKKGGGNNSNVQINQQFKFSGVESVIEELDRAKKNNNREQKSLEAPVDAEFESIEEGES